MLHFQHFQTRLLVFLLVPLVVVLAAVYLAVDKANTDNANALIRRDLEIGVTNFNATIADRNENLAIAGDALSSDYAFRQVWNSDRLTLLSAMNNLLGRLVTADFIAMVNADTRKLQADTRRPELSGVTPEWLSLIKRAEALDKQGKYAEASDVMVIDNHPYHVTVLPFLTPDLVGWITFGFEIGGAFTDDFKRSVSADVSVLFKNDKDQWQVSGSTLPDPLPVQLPAAFGKMSGSYPVLNLGNADYVSLASVLSKDSDHVQVLLQRSLAAQLAPYKALQQRLFTIFAAGLTVLLAVLILLSRNVTRPLQQLTLGARRITAGDYQQQVRIQNQDEIGELASAFNAMATGLVEKEQVRALLGKVVSPAIANELMSKPQQLGGEERQVTLMFTDIRDFTSLCENQEPQQILALLNDYFSMLTAVIESHTGVVDKYIGDAVMALFGAPVPDAAAPVQAIYAALAIRPALAQLNRNLAQRGIKALRMGIGINTDRVVVGNMGSPSRLNYTAIGDGVNLASRLEGLHKRYRTSIIVSESTRAAAPQFLYLPLDRVRVRGKQDPVWIAEPLCELAHAGADLLQAVAKFENFLQIWQHGDWQAAATALEDYANLARQLPELTNEIVPLYRRRLQQYLNTPPAVWDGVFTLNEK